MSRGSQRDDDDDDDEGADAGLCMRRAGPRHVS
jgi:hypothetical protein